MKRLNKIASLILTSILIGSSFSTCALYGCNAKTTTQLPPEQEVVENTNPTPAQSLPITPRIATSEGVKVDISGKGEVFSGQSITLTASVINNENQSVTWQIFEGNEFAEITTNGVLVAKNVDGDKIVKVRATSVADTNAKAEKVIIVTAKRVLTQSMLDKLTALDKIGFEGYVDIELYTIGSSSTYEQTHTLTVKTSMDGDNWYAEYENPTVGGILPLYYKKYEDLACEVGVNFKNTETYFPLTDDKGENVTWTNAGLYNNFKNLTVADFEFNTDTWLNEYKGSDNKLKDRAVAAANPYDFIAESISLIVEDGDIIGFRATSQEDYTVVQGYKAIQTLTVVLNYGDTVNVPTITKFQHVEAHDKLQTAINNMQALQSYKMDYSQAGYSVLISGTTNDGFEETITPDMCYFNPYTITGGQIGGGKKQYTGDIYGYKKIDDGLYNTFITNKEGNFEAVRAYRAPMSQAKPSFDFAAEIFTQYYEDETDGTTTYYVNEQMCPVASTWYYGVGNDIALYGIYSTKYQSQDLSFTPYVVVKDGKIIQSAFYYYLGYMYGTVEINYSDFDTATLPEDLTVEFETRQPPSTWNELTVQVTSVDSDVEDREVNALEYFKTMFNDDRIDEKLPFFGDIIGDTFGFGITTPRTTSDGTKMAVALYYDVPLGTDYSIDEPLKKIGEYLISLGFTKNTRGEYKKGTIGIAPIDSDLDLMIYIWYIKPNA